MDIEPSGKYLYTVFIRITGFEVSHKLERGQTGIANLQIPWFTEDKTDEKSQEPKKPKNGECSLSTGEYTLRGLFDDNSLVKGICKYRNGARVRYNKSDTEKGILITDPINKETYMVYQNKNNNMRLYIKDNMIRYSHNDDCCMYVSNRSGATFKQCCPGVFYYSEKDLKNSGKNLEEYLAKMRYIFAPWCNDFEIFYISHIPYYFFDFEI